MRCLEQADIDILCLPDVATNEAADCLRQSNTGLTDASTGHRVHDDWIFGFSELDAECRAAIATAKTVSKSGCYPTCAIALLHPLVGAGSLARMRLSASAG